MVHAKPKGTSPIRAYIDKATRAAGENGRMMETYIDRAISTAKTESVKTPKRIEMRLGFDFSNDKMVAADMKQDAIEAMVTKGVNDLR